MSLYSKKILKPCDTVLFNHLLVCTNHKNERFIDKFKGDEIYSLTKFLQVVHTHKDNIGETFISFIKDMPGVQFKSNHITYNGLTYHYYEVLLNNLEPEIKYMLEKRKILEEIGPLNALHSTKSVLKI